MKQGLESGLGFFISKMGISLLPAGLPGKGRPFIPMFLWEPHTVPMGRAGQVSASAPPHGRGPRGPRHMASQWGVQVLRLCSLRGRKAGPRDALKRHRGDNPTTYMGDNQTEPLHPPGLRGRTPPGSSGHVPADWPSPRGLPQPQPLQPPPAVGPSQPPCPASSLPSSSHTRFAHTWPTSVRLPCWSSCQERPPSTHLPTP